MSTCDHLVISKWLAVITPRINLAYLEHIFATAALATVRFIHAVFLCHYLDR